MTILFEHEASNYWKETVPYIEPSFSLTRTARASIPSSSFRLEWLEARSSRVNLMTLVIWFAYPTRVTRTSILSSQSYDICHMMYPTRVTRTSILSSQSYDTCHMMYPTRVTHMTPVIWCIQLEWLEPRSSRVNHMTSVIWFAYRLWFSVLTSGMPSLYANQTITSVSRTWFVTLSPSRISLVPKLK